MVTDFEDRLRQIRAERDRETRAKQEEVAAANQQRLTTIEQRFDRREKVEAVIIALAEKFIEEVQAFGRTKSFFEGKYKIEIAHDELIVDENGAPQKLFSRIAFLLDTTATDGTITVAVKKTVRNRDQEAVHTSVGTTSASMDEFTKFTEEQFFGFADAYFTGPAGSNHPKHGTVAPAAN